MNKIPAGFAFLGVTTFPMAVFCVNVLGFETVSVGNAGPAQRPGPT
jgi:hypothetical protein